MNIRDASQTIEGKNGYYQRVGPGKYIKSDSLTFSKYSKVEDKTLISKLDKLFKRNNDATPKGKRK